MSIAADEVTSLALGEPMLATVTLTNSAERSVSAPVELSLVSPDGTRLPFYRHVAVRALRRVGVGDRRA